MIGDYYYYFTIGSIFYGGSIIGFLVGELGLLLSSNFGIDVVLNLILVFGDSYAATVAGFSIYYEPCRFKNSGFYIKCSI